MLLPWPFLLVLWGFAIWQLWRAASRGMVIGPSGDWTRVANPIAFYVSTTLYLAVVVVVAAVATLFLQTHGLRPDF